MLGVDVAPGEKVKFKWGLPAQNLPVTFIPQFRDRKVEDRPEGLPGKYVVIFVFSRPGFALTAEREYKIADDMKGDSHLAITPPAYTPSKIEGPTAIKFRANNEEGDFVFTGIPNDEGFLGKVESEPFEASSFYDAEAKGYRALAPALSNLSIHLDIPLNVFEIESREIRSGSVRCSFLTPYSNSPFAIVPTMQMQPEFRGYASLYREALNSSSAVYRFLCFFKIIEAVRERRARLGSVAKKSGDTFSRPVEDVPADPAEFVPWLKALFPIRPEWNPWALDAIFPAEARGKRVGYVVKCNLYPLRHKIAHALLSGSGSLSMSADEMLHTGEVDKWLPLTKCVARRMLKNEFPSEFLAYLREDGTIVSAARG